MRSLMQNQIRHVQPLRKYICVPELMTNKANELAARHAYPFLYDTASLAPLDSRAELSVFRGEPWDDCGAAMDESVLRRQRRLTPGSHLRCDAFFFFFSGTSCCIALHQLDCGALGRLSLRCLVFTVKARQRSGVCSLNVEEGEMLLGRRAASRFATSFCLLTHLLWFSSYSINVFLR